MFNTAVKTHHFLHLAFNLMQTITFRNVLKSIFPRKVYCSIDVNLLDYIVTTIILVNKLPFTNNIKIDYTLLFCLSQKLSIKKEKKNI